MKRLVFALTAVCLLGAGATTLAHADQISTTSIPVSNAYDAYAPSVLKVGTTWRMWFGGWLTSTDQPNDKIFYTQSTDGGATWSVPVLNYQVPGKAVNDPSVIKVVDSVTGGDKYLMYYTEADYGTPDRKNLTGLATSTDGLNWTDQGVVIGYNNLVDNNGAWAPSAMSGDRYGNTVYLYYFNDNRPKPFTATSVFRSTMTGGGTTLSSTSVVIPADGRARLNVDVSQDPNGKYWMFYNSLVTTSTGATGYDTEKMFSSDGINWVESKYNPIQRSDTNMYTTPNVVWTGSSTYSLYTGFGDAAGHFASFHRILKENFVSEPETLGISASASSQASASFAPNKAIDGDQATAWSSLNTGGPSGSPQSLTEDLGSTKSISQVRLAPRVYLGSGYCFPTVFRLQSSTDGTNWTDVPGQSYSGYSNPGTSVQTFNFANAVSARYIRIVATGFSPDPNGSYHFQLGELDASGVSSAFDVIQSTDASSFASSPTTSGQVADSDPSTFWSSKRLTTATDPAEYIAADFGRTVPITRVALQPRTVGGISYGFPVDFSIETSNDGVTWTTVPGQVYTSYGNPSNSAQVFLFSGKQFARYARVVATRFRTDPNGNYYFQAADMSAGNN